MKPIPQNLLANWEAHCKWDGKRHEIKRKKVKLTIRLHVGFYPYTGDQFWWVEM